jgi:hypothetical protein
MTTMEIPIPIGIVMTMFADKITTDTFTSAAHIPVECLGKDYRF